MKKMTGLMASFLVLIPALPVAANPPEGLDDCGAQRYVRFIEQQGPDQDGGDGSAPLALDSFSREEALDLAGDYLFDSSRAVDGLDVSSKTRRFLGAVLNLEWNDEEACLQLPLWQIHALFDRSVRPGPDCLAVESSRIVALETRGPVDNAWRASLQVCFFEDGIAVHTREGDGEYVLFFRRAAS